VCRFAVAIAAQVAESLHTSLAMASDPLERFQCEGRRLQSELQALSPAHVFFTHASISSSFREGTILVDVIDQCKEGFLQFDNLQPIVSKLRLLLCRRIIGILFLTSMAALHQNRNQHRILR